MDKRMNGEKKNENFQNLQKALTENSFEGHFCSLYVFYTIMGNKWTLMIMGSLINGTKRNSDLQREVEGISPKMLNQTLKLLIKHKMVDKKVYPEVPPKVEYWLTEFGKSTADPLMALLNWTVEWQDELKEFH
ncbi:transcriptional regulator [Flavobacterium cupreum]|uniref:Transcriptional regulator n=1 Tax=Flavobacterium cupreum TaxID=2133766 RepID=A0A434ADK3_9FLAO|nr:helix-turn-helix domain-containing protein [Flavobacterium cupreum]RUT72445.1 transcriptional regulator [Flavobacterium cupreum]